MAKGQLQGPTGDPVVFDFNPENITSQLGNTAQVLQPQTPDGKPIQVGNSSPTQNDPRTPNFQFKFYLQAPGNAGMNSKKLMKDALTLQLWCAPSAAAPSHGGQGQGQGHGQGQGQGATGSNASGSAPTVDYVPVTFTWGEAFSYTGKLTAVTVIFLSFDDNGWPLVASVNVTLQTDATFKPPQNPTSGGTAPIAAHQVVGGDSLPSIAYQAYGKASYWRQLARLNAIDDPLRIAPGTMLKLPVLAELTQYAGD